MMMSHEEEVYGSTRHFNLKENIAMLRNMIKFAIRRTASLLDDLINKASPQFEFTVPPAAGSMVHTAEPAPEETTAAPVVTPVDKLEPTAPPSFDITTNAMVEVTVPKPQAPTIETSALVPNSVKPIAVCERPTRQCCNHKHPDTGKQCTNSVWLDVRSGLCEECAGQCRGCDREIPVQYTWCRKCLDKGLATKQCRNCDATIQFMGPEYCASCTSGTKRCKGQCGTKLPMIGPGYCRECGHPCAGPGCSAVIPHYFSHCLADNCQADLLMRQRRPGGTSAGAKAHAAHKAARAERDRAAARGGRGPKKG